MYKILAVGFLWVAWALPTHARARAFDVPRTMVEAFDFDFDQPKAEGLERFFTFKNPLNRGEAIRFNVESKEEIVYEVYNLVGKLVYRATPENKDGKHTVEIPTDEFQSGIYFLKASNGKTTVVKRFVLS